MNNDLCPRCGGIGKSWKMFDGTDVCDECWLDVAMDRQAMHWKESRAALATVDPSRGCEGRCSRTAKSARARREFPVRPARPRTDWQAKWAELVKPGYNSACLLCGHWFYGAVLEVCSRCSGRCVRRTDRDMNMMCRHATTFVESEQ